MPKVSLYHGTRDASLGAFREAGIGQGGDPNSALGVFFCEQPAEAVRYADPAFSPGGKPAKGAQVIVAEAELGRAFVVGDLSQFFGIDDTGEYERGHDDFAAVRQRLLDEGYDCLVTDGGMDENSGIWVVLDPARISVKGTMTVEAAWTVEVTPDYENVAMAGDGVLFADQGTKPSP